ncbi:hypothetical protein PsYK624_106740 [Phanerochaete sordida]|uniref:Uncharacterized protein n=1 Tax=Phanerochaete sordida TaxID=48140 RepID=A0A9P3GJ38_9APHY|nr:hypothetical protein PsYK624_106740 [Phanerochaete sordida]
MSFYRSLHVGAKHKTRRPLRSLDRIISAQSAPVNCSATFDWAKNSLGQNICFIAAYLRASCLHNSTAFTLGPPQSARGTMGRPPILMHVLVAWYITIASAPARCAKESKYCPGSPQSPIAPQATSRTQDTRCPRLQA